MIMARLFNGTKAGVLGSVALVQAGWWHDDHAVQQERRWTVDEVAAAVEELA